MNRALRLGVIGTRGLPSNYSGIERVSDSLYSILARRGHSITVYCRPKYTDTTADYYNGIRLVRTASMNLRSLETLSHAGTSIVHAILQADYDLIHIHALAPGLLSALPRLSGVPTVATVHGLDWQRQKWKGLGTIVLRQAERCLVKNVDAIITLSEDLQQYFQEEYGRSTALIPNGVERCFPNSSIDTEVLGRFGLKPGEYVLFVGRLVPEKRVEDLITAFSSMKTSCRLVIVGESSYTDDYVARLHKLAGKDPRVMFTGSQSGKALDTLYKGAALYVHPSELEGLPMSLLEAMEYGIPSIVSAIPPHRELLGGIDGYDLFFPAGNLSSLADRLAHAMSNEAHYRHVAARAQQYVRTHYSWSVIADRTETLFYDVVDRYRRR